MPTSLTDPKLSKEGQRRVCWTARGSNDDVVHVTHPVVVQYSRRGAGGGRAILFSGNRPPRLLPRGTAGNRTATVVVRQGAGGGGR